MAPIVSIVMPTKGRAELVKKSIGSVTMQTVQKWELLIMDVSLDYSIEKLTTDDRIKYYHYQPDVTVQERRFKATNEAASGQYLTFLDSDNYWAPERLERHLRAWESVSPHDDIGLSWDKCDDVNVPFSEGLVKPPKVAQKMYLGLSIHASSGFTKTKLAKQIDFSWTILSDWLLYMRLAEKHPAYFIDEPLTRTMQGSSHTVSSSYPPEYFYLQSSKVRRVLLWENPSVYFRPWLKWTWSRFRRTL